MRRDEQHVFAGIQADLHQVPAVQTQDRPSVRLQVPDLPQPRIQPLHRLEVRHDDDVMYLAGLVVLLVDQADLGRKQKSHFAPAGGGQLRVHGASERAPEPKQTILRRIEPFLQFPQPFRMREVSRPDHGQALERRPPVEVLRIQRLAGGPGKSRMEVNVGNETQGRIPRASEGTAPRGRRVAAQNPDLTEDTFRGSKRQAEERDAGERSKIPAIRSGCVKSPVPTTVRPLSAAHRWRFSGFSVLLVALANREWR